MTISNAKAAVDKEWVKTRENTGMTADESQNQKKDVIVHVRNVDKTAYLASLMVLCHLKNLELESQLRVVLRDDTARNYSRSYTVFSEQGSSA